MKKILSLLICFCLMTTAFTGCTAKETSGAKAEAEENAQLADDQQLSTYIQSDPRDIDPQTCVDSNGGSVLINCFDALVHFDGDGNILPGLAEEWKVSEDQKTYTFKLRAAKWSDDTPITAEDVVYSWIRGMKPETASASAFKYYSIVNAEKFTKGELKDESQLGVKVIDSSTFEVKLNAPTPYFLGLLNNLCYRPVKKEFVEKMGKDFAGGPDKMIYSGPFKFTSWDHEQKIVLEKNEHYWDAANVKLDKLTYHIIADENLPLNMYEAGEMDTIMLDSVFLDKYRGSEELQTMLINNLTYISYNCTDEFFKNKNLRKAFSLGINRDSYVNDVLSNGAKVLRGFVPYGFPGASTDKDFRSRNGDLIADVSKDEAAIAAEAKALLEKGLQELGKTKEQLSEHVSILVWDAEGKKLAQVAQQDWKKHLGIDLKIEPLTLAVCIDRMFKADYSLLVMGYGSSYIDPMSYLEMYTSDFPYQTSFWSEPEFDVLINKAKNSAGDERMGYLYEAEKVFMEGLPVAPIYNRALNYLNKSYVKNIIRSPFYGDDYSKAYIEKH